MQTAQDLLLLVASEGNRGDTNQEIALYCLAHFDSMAEIGITQLAQACHVSPATITRFCRAMGYDDFLHFKDECRLDLDIAARSEFYGSHGFNTDPCTMVGPGLVQSCGEIARDMQACLGGVDPAQLQKLAAAVRAAPDVLLLGMEFSGLITLYLQQQFLKRGKIVRVLRNTANLTEAYTTPETLLLMFSMNGIGLQLMEESLSRLSARCGSFWLVTQDPASIHYPCVTDVLLAGANPAPTYHRYVELALADQLLAAYGPLCRPCEPVFKK